MVVDLVLICVWTHETLLLSSHSLNLLRFQTFLLSSSSTITTSLFLDPSCCLPLVYVDSCWVPVIPRDENPRCPSVDTNGHPMPRRNLLLYIPLYKQRVNLTHPLSISLALPLKTVETDLSTKTTRGEFA